VLPHGGGIDGRSQLRVPAGTEIVWSTYTLNRQSDLFGKDWAEFRPERWENASVADTDYFMPFGSGPRACLGQQMALTTLSYVIVSILITFSEIACKDKRDFKEAQAVSFRNKYGTVVSMTE
jgi:cytochrome P450